MTCSARRSSGRGVHPQELRRAEGEAGQEPRALAAAHLAPGTAADVWGPPSARKLRFPRRRARTRAALRGEPRLGPAGPPAAPRPDLQPAGGRAHRRDRAERDRQVDAAVGHRPRVRPPHRRVGPRRVVEGEVRIGYNVVAGYTDQTLADLDPQKTLIDSVREIRGEMPTMPHANTWASSIPRRAYRPRGRLALGRREGPPRSRPRAARPPQPAAARRADQPSRHPSGDPRVGAGRVQRRGGARLPRPHVPGEGDTRILHMDAKELDLQWAPTRSTPSGSAGPPHPRPRPASPLGPARGVLLERTARRRGEDRRAARPSRDAGGSPRRRAAATITPPQGRAARARASAAPPSLGRGGDPQGGAGSARHREADGRAQLDRLAELVDLEQWRAAR